MVRRSSTPATRARASRAKVSAKWRRIIGRIPGYDPFKDAGDCHFDAAEAQLYIDFFADCITHVKGEMAGLPYILEPHEEAIVANLFGWKRPDGTRRYRVVFYFVPRKNSKTTFGGGLVLAVLALDGEPGAECYSSAAEREQAALAFDIAKQMVKQDDYLSTICVPYMRSLVFEGSASSYKAISADVKSKHGFNGHCILNDELHAHATRHLIDVLDTSTGARRQPIIVHITTSDFEREGSICNEKHDYATKVRDGIISDPSLLPVIYEASIDDDWTSEEVWAKANPNLGKSVKLEYLRRECKKAQEIPSYENTFKRLHLNIRTEQATRWLQMDKWDACDGDGEPIEAEFEGRECSGGLDLATTTDIAALVLVFPNEDAYDVLSFFWCPEENAKKREDRDRVPYLTWAREGLIEMTPGDSINYAFIRKRINEIGQQVNLTEIAYDPWNATQLATQLQEEDGFQMVQFRQGFISMNEPSKELERLVVSGKVNHYGNPVLRWMASNVSVKTDPSGNIKPDKQRSSEKIDGIVALVMAIGRAMLKQNTEQECAIDFL